MVASSLVVRVIINRTKHMEQENKPIIEHISKFLQYLDIERGLSENTIMNYEGGIRRFGEWLDISGKKELRPYELTKDDIWQFRVYLSERLDRRGNLTSKQTQNYLLGSLRALLDYFSAMDIPSLSSKKVVLSKEDRREGKLKFLELEQVNKLLDSPDIETEKGVRDKVILEIFFSTGLRVSELAALNKNQFESIWSHEDFELTIIGKGGYGRIVFFSKSATYWIKEYLKYRHDHEEPLIINYKSGVKGSNRLTTRSIERLVRKYTKKVGLPEFVTCHTLRHSYATNLLSQGVDLRSIQEFLGHRNIATTQIYTHVTNKQLRDTHRRI